MRLWIGLRVKAFSRASYGVAEPLKPFVLNDLRDGAFHVEGLTDIVVAQSVLACHT